MKDGLIILTVEQPLALSESSCTSMLAKNQYYGPGSVLVRARMGGSDIEPALLYH